MIGDRCGVSERETRRPYPCDDFVASPVLQAWQLGIDPPPKIYQLTPAMSR